jgi:hypothetical protein
MQYHLKSIDPHGVRRVGFTPPLALGNSLHAALAAFHVPGRIGPVEPAALLMRHWEPAGYASAAQAAPFFGLGAHALGQYLHAPVHHVGEVLGTEVYLARRVVGDGG